MSERVTLKGLVIAEIVAANPGARLKAVEYGSFGDIRRVEWYDEEPEPSWAPPELCGAPKAERACETETPTKPCWCRPK